MLEAVERTVSHSFLCLRFVVLTWRIGHVNFITQFRSQLGAARYRLESRPLPLLSFLFVVLSFSLLLSKTNDITFPVTLSDEGKSRLIRELKVHFPVVLQYL